MAQSKLMLATQILGFLKSLQPPAVPRGIEVMNPYHDKQVWQVCQTFYHKYYADNRPRLLVLGINPGRFGGGTTGIPFTDPLKLRQQCGIPNSLPGRAELSANFIYQVIARAGGPDVFYSKVYIGAVCPLGFTQNGRNMNYYDNPRLLKAVSGFCIRALRQQLAFGLLSHRVVCLGEGKNFEFLQQINLQHKLFEEIVSLPHPRFIMQYRRKELEQHIEKYVKTILA
jgi:hypothetical protein